MSFISNNEFEIKLQSALIEYMNCFSEILEYDTTVRSIRTTLPPVDTAAGKLTGLTLFISGFVILALGIVTTLCLSRSYNEY